MFFLNTVRNSIVYCLFLLLLFLFFLGNKEVLEALGFVLDGKWKVIFIVFMSIVLEALPFIFIGVLISSIIQIYIDEEKIRKMIPKNSISALIVALLIAIITPICECAIIPVVRRLVQKGVPLHAGVAILVGAPILNFVVFGATYYAFQNSPFIYVGRFILCMVVAIVVAIIILYHFSNDNVLKIQKNDFLVGQVVKENVRGNSRIKSIMHHSANEFFVVGKYFMVGAFLASVAQVSLSSTVLMATAQNSLNGTTFMMGLAFILSLCSEADAFVAASFEQIVRPESILAFLVFGPIIDLKNTLVMLSSFKLKFVLVFILAVFMIVLMFSLLAGILLVEGV